MSGSSDLYDIDITIIVLPLSAVLDAMPQMPARSSRVDGCPKEPKERCEQSLARITNQLRRNATSNRLSASPCKQASNLQLLFLFMIPLRNVRAIPPTS